MPNVAKDNPLLNPELLAQMTRRLQFTSHTPMDYDFCEGIIKEIYRAIPEMLVAPVFDPQGTEPPQEGK